MPDENKLTLRQLFLTNPDHYYERLSILLDDMVLWWSNEILGKLAGAPVQGVGLTEYENNMLEVLLVSSTVLSPAIQTMARAHGLDLKDPHSHMIMVRMVLLYMALVAKGVLTPPQPPVSPEEFNTIVELYEEEKRMSELKPRTPMQH